MSDKIFESAFPCFSSMSEYDKSILRDNTFDVVYKKGTNIHDGAECTGVILIESGSLRV